MLIALLLTACADRYEAGCEAGYDHGYEAGYGAGIACETLPEDQDTPCRDCITKRQQAYFDGMEDCDQDGTQDGWDEGRAESGCSDTGW